ncbi:MAG: Gfo/Idh/MocA family oxidoreductase [Spirochaetia bacterium]
MKTIGISFLDITHPHVWTRADIFRDMEGVTLRSVWEPNDTKGAKTFSERYGVTIADSPEAILKDRKVNAVVVESYTQNMADLTIMALEAGKAVLLEKPAANNPENMKRIVEASRKSTSLLQIGYMMRQGSMVDFARTVLDRRLLGRLTAARFHVSVPAPDAVTPWFNLKDDIGGVLFEDGCHMLDIVLHLMGRPRRISAFVPKFEDLRKKHRHMYEDAAVVNLDWGSCVGTMTMIGWEANEWIESWEMDFYGTEGTLQVGLLPAYSRLFLREDKEGYRKGWTHNQETQFNVSWLDTTAKHVWHAVQNRTFFAREAAQFVQAVRGKRRKAGVTPSDALQTMEVIQAAYQSSTSGRFVDL